MNKLLLLIIISSCAHKKASSPHPEEDLVSIKVALDQAQASYLRGCVEGLKKLRVPLAFNGCRDMSIVHRQELETIIGFPGPNKGNMK
jgi:hypothetical protein